MPILEVKNIHKSFGNTEVLKGIDFSLEKGDVLAIIGSSGSGKTTLLRCLNFLTTHDEGQIVVKGKVLIDGSDKRTLSEKEIRRNRLHFGLVFQSFADTMMVGQYGPMELSASGFVSNIFNLAIFFLLGISFGTTPVVGSGRVGTQKLIVQ